MENLSIFDWKLFIVLTVVCVPGLIVAIPQLINSLEKTIEANLRDGQKKPSKPVLIIVSMLQSLILIAIASALGTALAHRVGLHAPFFESLSSAESLSTESLYDSLWPQIAPALIVGTGGATIFIAAYYQVFRPRLDVTTIQAMETLRMGLGISGRILYGGVVEEVLTRWGLMSLFAWLGATATGVPSPVVMWLAIVVSGLLFAIGHLPVLLAVGCKKSPVFFTAMIGLNLWAALIFGWLFWQYGLLSAILAHMLFHILWLPFEKRP